MIIGLASFGFTPTNFGVTPAWDIKTLTDVCCFVVTSTKLHQLRQRVLYGLNGVDNLCNLLVHLRGRLVRTLDVDTLAVFSSS